MMSAKPPNHHRYTHGDYAKNRTKQNVPCRSQGDETNARLGSSYSRGSGCGEEESSALRVVSKLYKNEADYSLTAKKLKPITI